MVSRLNAKLLRSLASVAFQGGGEADSVKYDEMLFALSVADRTDSK